MRKSYLQLLFVLISLLCYSTGAWSAAGWTGYSTVSELNPTTSGRFLVKLKTAINPSDCKNKVMFFRDYGNKGSHYLFNTLLEALSRGKKVRLYVTGRCELNGYSEISSVSVIP